MGDGVGDHVIDCEFCHSDCQRPGFLPLCEKAQGRVVVSVHHDTGWLRRHVVHWHHRFIVLIGNLRRTDLEPSGIAQQVPGQRKRSGPIWRLHHRNCLCIGAARDQHCCQLDLCRNRPHRAPSPLPQHPSWRVHLRRSRSGHVPMVSASHHPFPDLYPSITPTAH